MIHFICTDIGQYKPGKKLFKPTFCLRQAAHALTFLEIPGSLLDSCWAPLEELVR